MSEEFDEYAVLDEFENSQAGHQQQQQGAENKRKFDNGVSEPFGGVSGYGTAPACPCGSGQCFVEKDKEGTAYFVCPAEEGEQCSFRRAVDSMKQSRTSAADLGPGHPSAGAPYSFSPSKGPGNSYQQGLQWGQQQQHSGEGGAGSGPPAPDCQCGEAAVLRTSNSSRNPGRQFYGCAKLQSDDTRCRFFKWLDEMGTSSQGPTATAAAAAANATRQEYPPSGQYGQLHQEDPGQPARQQQYGAGAAAPDAPPCACGDPSVLRTSNSSRNPGRQFFACAKPMNEPNRCNFFKWADAVGGSQAGGAAAGGLGYGAAAGAGYSGGASAAGNTYGGGAGGDVLCVCGQPAISRISNSERNPGRKFYKCPRSEAEGGCNWFKWADQLPGAAAWGGDAGYGSQQGAAATGAAGGYGFGGNSASGTAAGGDGLNGLNASGAAPDGAAVGTARFAWEDAARPQPAAGGSGYGGGGSSSTDMCYKCNQTGHWARDCPNVGTGAAAGGSGAGSGLCYKCNQPGHWARDCPGAGGSHGYGGGRPYGAAGGGRGGVCYKCNQPGHWASSCPNNG